MQGKTSSSRLHKRMEAHNKYSPGLFRESFQAYEEVGGQERMEAHNRYSPGIFRESFQAYEEVGGQEAPPPSIPSRRSSSHQVETKTD